LAEEFDPSPYVRAPMIDVPSGVALGVALLTALPKPTPDNVLNAANKVRQETVALQLAWAKTDSGGAPPDRRKSDMRIDNAWAILLDRLEAYSLLPVAAFSRAPRARELTDILSPNDREWLNYAYEAEWAESNKRLKRIEDEGLAKDIDELAGPEFLAEVRHAHDEYGVAVGVTQPAHDKPEVNLAEPLRALARSIGRYGIAVAGMINDDPESVAVVRRALRPIDSFREGQARRTRAGSAAVEAAPEAPASPTTPVPEVK
jgi:hypothetical protein